MEETKLDHSNGALSNATRSRELEARYIELLEKRIAALEALTKDQKVPLVSVTVTRSQCLQLFDSWC